MRACPVTLVLLVHLLGLTAADDDPEAPIDPKEFEDLMKLFMKNNDYDDDYNKEAPIDHPDDYPLVSRLATPLPMQCTDKGCSKEWDGQGVCVDFSDDVDFETLCETYDLSAGSKKDQCGHKEPNKEDCCHCLKKPQNLTTTTTPVSSTPTPTVTTSDWETSTTITTTPAPTSTTTQPQDPGPCIDLECSKEWDGHGVCVDFSNTTANFFENLGIKYDLSAGEKEERCGHKIPGKEDCCHCLKLPDECSQTEKCKDVIGKCVNKEKPVPAGNIVVPDRCEKDCQCITRNCSQTRICDQSGGKCYKRGTEPEGSQIIPSDQKLCNERANCFCYSPPQPCTPTRQCDVDVGGKCIGNDEPVPTTHVVAPKRCRRDCKCITPKTRTCVPTVECEELEGRCYKFGTAPQGSKIISKSACHDWDNCYCYKAPPPTCVQTKTCQENRGKCVPDTQLVPQGFDVHPEWCERGCKCLTPQDPPCKETDVCKRVGGKCYKRGDEPTGWDIVGKEMCNSKNNCYCYKAPGTTGCKPDGFCEKFGGICIRKDLVPPGTEIINPRFCDTRGGCNCYNLTDSKCRQTEGCTDVHGQCISEDDPIPTGLSLVPDDDHQHHRCEKGCQCVGPDVPGCGPTPQCTAARGKCITPSTPVPDGAINIPNACNGQKPNCECWAVQCQPTRPCSSLGGTCFKKGTEPKGSKLISTAACITSANTLVNSLVANIDKPDDAPCFCYKTPPVICAPTPGCSSAGGRCIGELDAIPAGLAIVSDDEHGHHECNRGCKCVGRAPKCIATKKCSSVSGQCLGPQDRVPAGATEVPDYCADNCKCWVNPPRCLQTRECSAQRGICVPGIFPRPASSIIPNLCRDSCQCLRRALQVQPIAG